MEWYYEKINKKYRDTELAIEAIFYENDLINTFGPAMEDGDSTIASPTNNGSGNNNGSSNTESDNSAARQIDMAGKKISDGSANTVNRSSDRQITEIKNDVQTIASSKSLKEFTDNLKLLIRKIVQFIRENITELKASMSDMLRDGVNIEKEIDEIMRTHKLNPELRFSDYEYDDRFLDDYNKAVNSAFASYTNQYSNMIPKFREMIQYVKEGKIDEAKQFLGEVRSKKPGEKDKEAYKATDAEINAIKIKKPHYYLAKQLNFRGARGKINVVNIKQFAYCKFKNNGRPGKPEIKRYYLRSDMYKLNNAKTFMKSYRNRLQTINKNRDYIEQCANSYRNLCNELSKIEKIDDQLKNSLNNTLQLLAHDLNELVTFNEFSVTMIKERAVSAEILIKAAYGVKFTELAGDNNKKEGQENG